VTGDLAEPETSDLTQPCLSIMTIEVVTTTGMVTTWPLCGRALPIANARFPPGEVVRAPSSSSTALDPEPMAQTDPKTDLRTFTVDLSGNPG